MKEKKKKEWRIVFWHNDFPDGSRQHSWYGKDGPIYQRVRKKIAPEAGLKWHFHGGFISKQRENLLRRLRQADVLIAAYPWNMDMDNNSMHWLEAEESLLSILDSIKQENPKLKIFFLHEPNHHLEEFLGIGEFIADLHDDILYDYFS